MTSSRIFQETWPRSAVERRAQCPRLMHLSIIPFLSGATPPEKAKLSNSFLHSKLWNHRAQSENKSHSGKEMHIKNTRCSFQIRGVVGLHSFPLQNSIKKKKKGTGSSLLCYRLRRWRSILRVLGVSLQASCLSPVAPRVPLAWNQSESCINTQVICISSLEVCSRHSEPAEHTVHHRWPQLFL